MTPEIALSKVGQAIINEIPNQLKKNGSNITGNLAKSYVYEVKQTRNGWTLSIIDESGKGKYNYGLSVEDGLERGPGKQPPVKPILEWIKIKKITVPPGFKPEAFAFAIAKNISKKGQRFRKPKPFLQDTINVVFQTDDKELQEAAQTIIESQLEAAFK
jgi:hypothetical protein